MQTALINYQTILTNSWTDGPRGPRTVLFMQGCTVRCPGCQNQQLWPREGGTTIAPSVLADMLIATGQPITITGGEPTDQPLALAALMIAIRWIDPNRDVIVYTGRTMEDLVQNHRQAMIGLNLATTVVDGPYIADQDDDHLQWRGSANQRAIDMAASLQAVRQHRETIAALPRYLICEDWAKPHLMFTPAGVLGAAGLIDRISSDGTDYSHRCGQAE
jgi:anaerobic ribonucleoside-triphosphate reductase activating protein